MSKTATATATKPSEKPDDEVDDKVKLTELEKISPTRVDGVGAGANGFPLLMMKAKPGNADGQVTCPTCDGDGKIKGDSTTCPTCRGDGKVSPETADAAAKSVPTWHPAAAQLVALAKATTTIPASTLFKAIAADGSVDEQPDIDGGKQAIALLAKLIGYEAQELGAGCLGEVWDISLLCDAVAAVKCWLTGEQMVAAGDSAPQVDIAMSAAKADLSTATINDLPDSAFAYIEPGGSKDADGKTTPRSLRHFPVHDKAHADNAAARIAQGAEFGDKAKAKVEAAQRKFDSTSAAKAAGVAGGEPIVDTGSKLGSKLGTDDLKKVIGDAITEANRMLIERQETLEKQLAQVLKRPIPGGPVTSITATQTGAYGEARQTAAAKAAYYEQMAKQMASLSDADAYRQLARDERDKAGITDIE